MRRTLDRDNTRLEIDYQSISIADYNPENKKGVKDLAKWHLKESRRKVKKLLSDETERKHRIQEIVQWKESVIKKQVNELGLTNEPEIWNVRENMNESHTIRQRISEKISECFKQVNFLQKNHQTNRREKSKAAALTKFYTTRLNQEQKIKKQLQKQLEDVRERMNKKHRATEDLLVNNSHTLAKDLVKLFVRRMRDIDEGVPDDVVDWAKHGSMNNIESERNLDNLLASKDEVMKQKQVIKDLNLTIKKYEMKEKQKQIMIVRRNQAQILDDHFVLERLSTLQEDREMGFDDDEDDFIFGGKTPGDQYTTPLRKQLKEKKLKLSKSSRDVRGKGFYRSSPFDQLFVEDHIAGIREEIEDKTVIDLHRETSRSNFLVRARRRGYRAVERIVQIGNFNEEEGVDEVSRKIWEVLKRETEEEENRREMEIRNYTAENERLNRHVQFLEKIVRKAEMGGGSGGGGGRGKRSRMDNTDKGDSRSSSSKSSSRSRSRSSGPDFKKVVDRAKKELKVKNEEIKKLTVDNKQLKKKIEGLMKELNQMKKKFDITKEKLRQLQKTSKEAIRRAQSLESKKLRRIDKEREEMARIENEKERLKRDMRDLKKERMILKKKQRKFNNDITKFEHAKKIAEVKKMQSERNKVLLDDRQRKVKKGKEELSKTKKMIEGEKRRIEREKLKLKRELDVKKMLAKIQHKYKMEELKKKESIIGKIERKERKTTPRKITPTRKLLENVILGKKQEPEVNLEHEEEEKEVVVVVDKEDDDKGKETTIGSDEKEIPEIKIEVDGEEEEKEGKGDENVLELEDMADIMKRINELEEEEKKLDGASDSLLLMQKDNEEEEKEIERASRRHSLASEGKGEEENGEDEVILRYGNEEEEEGEEGELTTEEEEGIGEEEEVDDDDNDSITKGTEKEGEKEDEEIDGEEQRGGMEVDGEKELEGEEEEKERGSSRGGSRRGSSKGGEDYLNDTETKGEGEEEGGSSKGGSRRGSSRGSSRGGEEMTEEEEQEQDRLSSRGGSRRGSSRGSSRRGSSKGGSRRGSSRGGSIRGGEHTETGEEEGEGEGEYSATTKEVEDITTGEESVTESEEVIGGTESEEEEEEERQRSSSKTRKEKQKLRDKKRQDDRKKEDEKLKMALRGTEIQLPFSGGDSSASSNTNTNATTDTTDTTTTTTTKKKVKRVRRIKKRKKRRKDIESNRYQIWGQSEDNTGLGSLMKVSNQRPKSQQLKKRRVTTSSIAVQTEGRGYPPDYHPQELQQQHPHHHHHQQQAQRMVNVPRTNENTVVITYDNRPLEPTIKPFPMRHRSPKRQSALSTTTEYEKKKDLRALRETILSSERQKLEEQMMRDRRRLLSNLERERHLVFQERELLRRKASKHEKEVRKRVDLEMRMYRNRLEDSGCQTDPVNFSQLMVEKVVDMIDRTLRNPKDDFTQYFLKMHFKRFRKLGVVSRPGTSGGVVRSKNESIYNSSTNPMYQYEMEKKRKEKRKSKLLGGPEVVALPRVRSRPKTSGSVRGSGRRKRSVEWSEIIDKYDRVTSPPRTHPSGGGGGGREKTSGVEDYVRVRKDRYVNDIVFGHPKWKPGVKRNSQVKFMQSPYVIGKGRSVSSSQQKESRRSMAPISFNRKI